MKKGLPIFPLLAGLLIVGGILLLASRSKPKPPPPQNQEEETTTTIPQEQRPFVKLVPGSDGHRVTLDMENIKGANLLEFEIYYEATTEGGDRIERGIVADNISLSGSTYVSKEKLFGSASSGKEKYDKDVQGTTFLIRLNGVNGRTRFEGEWRLSTGTNKLVLGDDNFIFEGGAKNKSPLIAMSTIGLPGSFGGEILAGPYGIFTAGSTAAKGTIKLRLDKPVQNAQILGWDESSGVWKVLSKNLKTEQDSISVEIDQLTTFIVARP